MNIFPSTSQHPRKRDSSIHPLARGVKMVLATSLIAFSCFAFSPAWAGDYTRAKATLAPIQLTGLSIQIGPGGFHIRIGVPSYGRAYGRSHVHVRPVPRPYWKSSRHPGHRHHYVSPKRFNHRHGWKNDGHRGNFRGKGGRGNGGHRGGRR